MNKYKLSSKFIKSAQAEAVKSIRTYTNFEASIKKLERIVAIHEKFNNSALKTLR